MPAGNPSRRRIAPHRHREIRGNASGAPPQPEADYGRRPASWLLLQGLRRRAKTALACTGCSSSTPGSGPNRLDVFAALDMTLPGILSQASIAQGSAWIEVPDPRSWA